MLIVLDIPKTAHIYLIKKNQTMKYYLLLLLFAIMCVLVYAF